MKSTYVIASLLLAATGAVGSLAYAQARGSAANDAVSDLAKAKIGFAQAVATAEASATGKATRAELDSEHGKTVFEIEVVTADNKVLDIIVDAADGKVLSSKADGSDHGKKEERD